MEANAAVDGTGNPIPTSAVLTASAKHIGIRCMPENMAFLKCKKNDPNPEKCLEKGRDVTRCVLGLYVSSTSFSFQFLYKFLI
ncbi:Cox19-like CHCH family protein [Arabidopsis thaliana]|jgi:NADH dehydrogenase (ubiquinone) 1 alpha subcomplex subunit 8|uniref:Cox19-like CHCH family protein n=1 Tax=Arabidopsis thaliana TaxID=3702 RepID=B3H556_ARATH|nr:Cox19-like CHCH family protein [Arabidopsis thaliana]AEE74372.1 Cox19-like CHCH family protein [Arabidopsis thaliana]|eukprot:NP_001118589.1 Cox19-like CHCH family protein [Arabidopsis thaliana]